MYIWISVTIRKLLPNCSGMKRLGGLGSLLCYHQRRADLCQPCIQFFNLLVLYRKLLVFTV